MTRRLQVLLDEERMNRLERYANERGTSVATVIRDAIDATVPRHTPDERRAAIERLLAAPPMPVVDDWMEMKRIAREGYYDE